MAKRNSEPKFLPCVATHYRNVMKTQLRRVIDIRECIVDQHNGSLVPEIVESLDRLETQVFETLQLLDAKCSKPEFTTVDEPTPIAE